MNGTMPYVAPSEACTQKEKMIITTIALANMSIVPSTAQKAPSRLSVSHRIQSLPRMPKKRAEVSDMMPPTERANRFIMPKADATRPAMLRSSSNLSKK